MKIVFHITIGFALAAGAVLDIRKREVSLALAAWIAAVGAAGSVFLFHRSAAELLTGLIPGGVALVLAALTGEHIGYGDGWMLLALGLAAGGGQMLSITLFAVFVAGAVALVLLILFHKSGRYEMPFIPFLLAGYTAAGLCRWLI